MTSQPKTILDHAFEFARACGISTDNDLIVEATITATNVTFRMLDKETLDEHTRTIDLNHPARTYYVADEGKDQ